MSGVRYVGGAMMRISNIVLRGQRENGRGVLVDGALWNGGSCGGEGPSPFFAKCKEDPLPQGERKV
jgi:hypothetical protein